MLTPTISKAFAVAGMTSATGRCHTFDAAADGYVRAEGCGALVLKPMADATNDTDRIHAVVQGVGVAQDGISASLTAPNGQAQQKLLRHTLHDAQLDGHDVDYLEAHGTGTALGDPIEMNALASVMGDDRSDECPLVMGAVKANIGHLEPGAGAAGLIKAVLVLQHELAPPNAELKTLNPKIEAVVGGFPVHFPVSLEPLRQHSGREADAALVAGVSSFGYAGTIAHTVMCQPSRESARSSPATTDDEADSAFPNRKSFPWLQSPPHPLLQQTVDLAEHGTRHTAVFHPTLMELFKDHTIQGRTLFPGAGF
eukprot:SAG31_NODE_11777_length_999_cov_1.294444_1_plen_310_part_10